ncbi:DUF2796 domain-containing protein [Amphritea balenae]|uniref:DUF2796 domain-containing protein n=1 Tax=Amphritea balenae TaxID=452629 RepID=A0A3P1SVQ0_9GAMM|nr:DUF2796 domain-containing protein [Amphritea balenae]RRD01282.1 DUF2796 domain-containing protein [Amphritea balenae]GGK58476.1 hypothetical protein GCM10007941_05790 [Amphritea balenae]
MTQNVIRIAAATAISLGVSSSVMAFERQHDSHEHGAATLLLAVEGNELQLRIESPAANFLGFEHAPETAEQHQQLEQTVALLRDSKSVISLPEAADCRTEMTGVRHSLEDEEHEDDHSHDDEHQHDEHSDHDEKGHDDHDTEHAEKGGHSDFTMEYHFECASIESLSSIRVELFRQFPLLKDLDVQYITPAGQGAVQLTPDNAQLSF